ncbi:subtilase family protein [Micromonospora pisi]|uniref:Subtilase family protein n=1 Tax=Micromonospora pisi TaxID=589240 RepID=A0A495JJJ2_9ACTN|nr:S8 family serine peptidase [Micromonospora pisi]RKR88855.1 subtilase family protein [Micromonospora pisi]
MQVGPAQPADEPAPPPFHAVPVHAGGGPWPVVAAVLIGCWAVAVTVGAQLTGWSIEQLLLVGGVSLPAWVWPVTGLANAVLVGVPAGLLALLPRSATVRATGRVWLVGALALGVFGLLRAIPLVHQEGYLAALTVVATLAATLVRRRAHRPDRPEREPALIGTGLAIAAGLALLLPWLWLGALGGRLESALALTSAAALGWFATTLLDQDFWAGYERHADGRPAGAARLVLLGGLVAGVALLLVAGGTGPGGSQLAALLVLPPAGFTVAALRRLGHLAGSAPTGWLVGLAAVGPLALVDPEEISILLATTRDVPYWTALAAGASLAIALLAGLGYGLAFGRVRAGVPRRAVAATVTVVLVLAAGGIYLGLGQPGWYGERLFVVLKEQAPLDDLMAGPTGATGQPERVREVHRRLVGTALRAQADLRHELDRWGLAYRPYYLVNAIEVTGGPVVRGWLSRRDDVDRVLISQDLRPLPAPASTHHSGGTAPTVPSWNLTQIGADQVWAQLRVDGSGIVVGSSDSGVDGHHPALVDGFRGGDDSWYDPWNGTRFPSDSGGHGTHTLASAVGDENVGVAPGASWIGCVNLDRNLGNPAHYLDCLQFMLAPFPTGGDPFTDGRPDRAPQVLTNSWGCPPVEGCDAGALRPATAAFAAAGIFFTAAAGNTGPRCASIDDPPAPYADVFTVGAVDRDRRVAPFSSRGPAIGGAPKPDLVAPGADVLSAMPGGGYEALSGTSMATPHVAGVVALMWSANPALIGDLDRTRQILRDTATPVSLPGANATAAACGPDSNSAGAGLLNAPAAVHAALG